MDESEGQGRDGLRTPRQPRCPMIQIRCPFCDEASPVDLAEFSTTTWSLRCDACGVTVEIAAFSSSAALPLAA